MFEKGFRKGIADKLGAEKTFKKIEELCGHIEDISEAQDELVKAVVSLYNNQQEIAKKLSVELPEPLIDMSVEEGNIKSKNKKVVEAEIFEDKSVKKECDISEGLLKPVS